MRENHKMDGLWKRYQITFSHTPTEIEFLLWQTNGWWFYMEEKKVEFMNLWFNWFSNSCESLPRQFPMRMVWCAKWRRRRRLCNFLCIFAITQFMMMIECKHHKLASSRFDGGQFAACRCELPHRQFQPMMRIDWRRKKTCYRSSFEFPFDTFPLLW